ncbi:MAG TPA: hypothetical protein VIJ18_14705 [Microbacteriaceae bacterium]
MQIEQPASGVTAPTYGNVNADTNGFITLTEKTGDLRVGVVKSTDDDVTLTSPGSIFDAPLASPNPPPTGETPPSTQPDVLGVNITLTAQNGTIGQNSNFLEIQSSIDRFGVLNAHAPGVIRVSQTTGDLHVDTVTTCFNSSATSCADISLTNFHGSITDGHNAGAGGTSANIIGNTIDLLARFGSLGDPGGGNDLKLDSAKGSGCFSTYTLLYQGANYQNATDAQRAVTATCDVAAQADGSIFLTQVEGPFNVLLAHAGENAGAVTAPTNVRLTSTETGAEGNDILLLHSGSTLVVENAPQTVAQGLIEADNGNVMLRSADDIVTDPSSMIIATTSASDTHPGNGGDPNRPANLTGNIDIYGDCHGAATGNCAVATLDTSKPDPTIGDGTVIVLRSGQSAAGGLPGGIANGVGGLTRVFGANEADTIIFDRTILVGQTRAYGDGAPTQAGVYAPACNGPANMCVDSFVVNRLQSMIPLGQDVARGATLTLDGQSGSNVYSIFTSGSQFTSNNYEINVLGSHAPADGTDTLNIYGYDTYTAGAPNSTGINPSSNHKYATNDIFLLRGTPAGIIGETAARPPLYQGTGAAPVSADPYSAGSGFVALLHSTLANTQANLGGTTTTGTTGVYGVERINYDSAINGGLHVYSLGGNNYFAVDDNAAPTYLDGGSGDNSFQIGQLYGERRTAGAVASPAPSYGASGNLASENVFDVATVATTRGWLSRGTSAPLVAQGGTGNNTFTVYSNHAVLHLEGNGGNNLFIVRGFALAKTDAAGNIILPGGCTTIEAPACIPIPITTNGYSTAAQTDVRTGAGNNQVEYNMNAPVSVDGGTGFNKLIILGTEFADHIVVTDHGIFGAGMSVTFRNIQVIEVDALEGDDTIDVLSTAPGVAVRVIGGLGSNQVNVAGDVSGNVYSRDINGTSGTVNLDVITNDQLYQDLVIPGVSVSVAQGSQGAVIVTEHAGGTIVKETQNGSPVRPPIGTIDSYTVRLAQEPTSTVYIAVTAEPDIRLNREGTPQGDSILLATGPLGSAPNPGTTTANSDFYQHVILDAAATDLPQRSLVLVFTAGNWQVPQIVWAGAMNDALNDGVRTYEISHTVLSADPFYANATVRNVEVTKIDPGSPAILVTNLGNTNTTGTVPASRFTDGVGNGTATFSSASAVFTLGDIGQQIVETDGGVAIPANTVILSLIDATHVLLSAPIANASGIGFALPSRLVAVLQYRDGGTTAGSPTLTSASAGFNQGDIGRSVVEADTGSAIPTGATIVAVAADGSSATLSAAATATVSGLVFALPARNASNLILGGSGSTITGISGYSSVVLAAAPTATVYVTITAANDPRIMLASTDPRFSVISNPDGVHAGVYRLTFTTGDWSTPVVIREEATLWYSPADPHNSYLTATVAVGSAADYIGVDNSLTPWDVLVMNDLTPAGIVQAPDNMVVTKCGDALCTRPGAGSSFSLRLASAPTSSVTVAMITDGQTDVVVGGRVTLGAIGAPKAVGLFTGNVTVAGAVITLAAGSELGSLISDGFKVGQLVRLSGGTYAGAVTATILAVTATTMTLNVGLAGGSYTGVTIARIVNAGAFTGPVIFNALAGTLTRADGSSWLDDGFLEGQIFKIGASGVMLKIHALTGTTSTRVDVLTVTDPAALAAVLGASGPMTLTLTQWAAQITFTPGNWWMPVAIPLLADPKYNVPAGNTSLLSFPKTPHLLSNIRGPLSVEGGPTVDNHAALQLPVMLPGEGNSVPFGIGVQPPEAQQVNVLNIFDDGSQQNQTGTLSSTTLSGFGIGPGLDFTHHKGYVPSDPTHPTFGEPPVFPSGISFGSITVDPVTGQIQTNASLSTIQVLNLMQGQGNDNLTVTGTLVGGPFTNEDGTPGTTFVHGGLTVLNGGGASALSITGTFAITATTITRADGTAWATDQFTVGQALMWNGVPFGVITGVSGSTLTFVGIAPTTGSAVPGTVAIFDPAIHVTTRVAFGAHQLVRTDMRSWREAGFAVGQTITIDGVLAGIITAITGPTNDILTVSGTPAPLACSVPGACTATVAVASASVNPVRYGGNVFTVTGGAGPGPGATPPTVSGSFTTGTSGASATLTRATGSWLSDGFVYGMVLQVGGLAAWTITGVTASVLTVSGPAFTNGTVTVSVVGYAPSPLVVYGSTSQDGIWYSGDPHTQTSRVFGSKPFPNQVGNGTPQFVFPVANPFRHAGNNVIDARALFAAVPAGQVPSIGLTIYGGSGDDTIYGSQAGDVIAGGSGDNTIYGGRGDNIILGANGLNTNIITRTVTFPTANASVYTNADPLAAGDNLIYGDVPGATTTDRYGDYNNLIFGAMGVVTQDTSEATVGVLGATRTVTGSITSHSPSGTALNGVATVTCATACFVQSDVGLAIGDAGGIFLSPGTIITAVSADGTTATLSRNAIGSVSVGSATLTVGPPQGYCRPTGGTSTNQYCAPSGTTPWGDARVEKLQTTRDILEAASDQPQNHGDNRIYASGGDNVIIGGDGNNDIQGGPGRNLIIAGSAALNRTTHLFNYTNARFQDLAGTQLYSTTAGSLTQSLTDGTAQNDPTGRSWWGDFLSGTGGILLSVPLGDASRPATLQDSAYKGADYIAGGSGSAMIFGESNNNIIQAHGSIDITAPDSLTGYPTVSNGSPSIGSVFGGAATCSFRGYYLGNRVGGCRDATNALLINPSVDDYAALQYALAGSLTFGAHTITRTDGLWWADGGFAVGQTLNVNGVAVGVVTAVSGGTLTVTGAPAPASCTTLPCTVTATVNATDGQSYIEGGRGNNTIFANRGQNDIIGGNSDFFSLTLPSERASGSNLIFGGSGLNAGREDCGDGTLDATNHCVTNPNGHAHDANVIVANNGEIIRLVGTKGQYGVGNGVAMSVGYLNFNYDVNGYLTATERIITRAVNLLDSTPGGPDLANQPGPQVTGAAASNGIGDIGGTPITVDGVALMRGSEIHAESGDAFIYGGPANDVIYGGGQNDTIITGYADNWVSGGRGDTCIIGGGGRCLTSRVSSSYGEPLYAIAPIPAANISQLITTPGNVQQAVINVNGALNYTVVLWPYNWDPTANGSPSFATGCKQNAICAHYQPRFGHNIIYGGWGGGVIHAGPGQSAVSGAEAPELGYADNFDMSGNAINATPYETDWYHPFNPGNPMGWHPLADNGNGNAARALMAGKASYFDPEDPRREIFLNAVVSNTALASGFNPLDCKWAPGQTPAAAGCLPWFLTFDPTDAGMPLDTTWYPGTGDPQMPTTGDKAIFGDLGNDWIVAGMGRVRVYGGWGNDVIDVRASTQEDGGLNDGPVPNLVRNADGSFSLATANFVYGTPAWETLAYGGGGQDIFFAGTGGDRLIDWVGNHNSYYVPFSQFGMPAVSRTLQPFLPEFLYALSKSDGADQTLMTRYAAFDTRYSGLVARNGEPYGELGLVLQHDDAWHQQVGPPFNEMPENLGGTGIDVQKTANIRPFNSPGTDPPASALVARVSLPSGTGVNLPSGTNPAGASAVPLLVTGAPGATVVYSFVQGRLSVTGGGIISAAGTFGAVLDLSAFSDGVISVTVTITGPGGTVTPLQSAMGKNSVAPPAPSVSVAAYANLATRTTFLVTVRGQSGSIANVVITDGSVPIARDANGMDMVDSTGVVVIPVDVSNLIDGTLTITVTLTNGAGVSASTTVTTILDSVPPPLTVTGVAPYITVTNAGGYSFYTTGQPGAVITYVFSDGSTTVTGTKAVNGSGQWNINNVYLSPLRDGPVVLTVTETEPSGNQTVFTQTLIKKVTTTTTMMALAVNTTPPTIGDTITAPSNGTSYDITQNITLTFSAVGSGSDVASVRASIDGVTWGAERRSRARVSPQERTPSSSPPLIRPGTRRRAPSRSSCVRRFPVCRAHSATV